MPRRFEGDALCGFEVLKEFSVWLARKALVVVSMLLFVVAVSIVRAMVVSSSSGSAVDGMK